MRVLVTGSSGFMGLALSEAIIDAGNEVVGFDIKPPPFPDLAWMDKFTVVQGDIGEIRSFSGQFKRMGITHVVHAAAMTPGPEREREVPDIIATVNIVGAYRLMLMAADIRPERVVYLSSISAYGPAIAAKNGRYDERATHAAPEALYGISKLAAERGMKRIAQMNEVDLRTIRLGPVFGAWEHSSEARDILSPHHQAAKAARTGEPCILPRPFPADWIYSRDAARRIGSLLMRQGLNDDLFNLGGGAITSVADWCRALATLAPDFSWSVDAQSPTVRYPYATDRPALDNRRIDASVPSGPHLTLEEAAKDYWTWLHSHSLSPVGAV
jgi:UDP-glucose 4-epimerase